AGVAAPGGAPRRCWRLGRHKRDRLSLEADHVPGKNRLVGCLGAKELVAGHVLVGEYGVDASQCKRRRDVDSADASVGMRTTNGGAPEHEWCPEVGRVGKLALDLRGGVGAAHALADPEHL